MTTQPHEGGATPRASFGDRVITVIGIAGIWLFTSGLLWDQVMFRRIENLMMQPAGREHGRWLSVLVHVPADLMMITGSGGMITHFTLTVMHACIRQLRRLLTRQETDGGERDA